MSRTYSTPPEVAKRYSVKPQKVLAWIRSGELVAVNVAERANGRPRWRVSEEALETFERRRSSRPEPTKTSRKNVKVPQYV